MASAMHRTWCTYTSTGSHVHQQFHILCNSKEMTLNIIQELMF